jgi:hypothetical protein
MREDAARGVLGRVVVAVGQGGHAGLGRRHEPTSVLSAYVEAAVAVMGADPAGDAETVAGRSLAGSPKPAGRGSWCSTISPTRRTWKGSDRRARRAGSSSPPAIQRPSRARSPISARPRSKPTTTALNSGADGDFPKSNRLLCTRVDNGCPAGLDSPHLTPGGARSNGQLRPYKDIRDKSPRQSAGCRANESRAAPLDALKSSA